MLPLVDLVSERDYVCVSCEFLSLVDSSFLDMSPYGPFRPPLRPYFSSVNRTSGEINEYVTCNPHGPYHSVSFVHEVITRDNLLT